MRAGVEQNSSATSTYSVFDVPFLRTIGDELVDLQILLRAFIPVHRVFL